MDRKAVRAAGGVYGADVQRTVVPGGNAAACVYVPYLQSGLDDFLYRRKRALCHPAGADDNGPVRERTSWKFPEPALHVRDHDRQHSGAEDDGIFRRRRRLYPERLDDDRCDSDGIVCRFEYVHIFYMQGTRDGAGRRERREKRVRILRRGTESHGDKQILASDGMQSVLYVFHDVHLLRHGFIFHKVQHGQ